MRICSPQLGISPEAILGGEVNDREVLKNLAEMGVKIDIILPYGKKHEKVDNWSVYQLPVPFIYPPWTFNFWILPCLFFIYNRNKFDIIKIHSPKFVGPAALMFKLLHPDVKLLVVYHHLEDSWISRTIDRILIPRCNYVVAVSSTTKNEMIRRYGLEENKVKTICLNGLDKRCRPGKKDLELLDKYGLSKSKVLLYFGQLIPRKNVGFLFTVLKLLPNEWKLLICGSGPDKQNLEEEAISVGVANRVVFAGRVPEDQKVKHFNLANIFVCPSIKEGFGIVVIEAMACGKVVLVSKLDVFNEIVTQRKNGYLEELNPSRWAELIKEINAHSQESVSKLAIVRAKQFDWLESTNRLLNYLKN